VIYLQVTLVTCSGLGPVKSCKSLEQKKKEKKSTEIESEKEEGVSVI
jgi:hypothetical protein